ncbi:ankyrin repeat-containing domain protein [Diaporthe sp. PMI_573]|nr:ankyrin repeat-containing domain protein [Diaporthaceae sp. PMI_573]
MRALWVSGSASLDAVDPYNLGLLYYATYYCWRNRDIETSVATFGALVHAGANVGWMDNLGNTPLDTMIDIFLVESAMRGHSFMTLLSKLSGLFGKPADEIWSSYLYSRGFTDLHNVLLKLNTDIPLEAYLTKMVLENGYSSILHARDLTGRTVLDWAVEHGWLCAAKTLIHYGADVKQSRGDGLSMLHLALAGPVSERGASFLEIVQLLLANGADANAIDDEGWTPLHIAASWGSDSAVELLRQYSDDTLVTYCCETADQLAQKNRDGQCLTKCICT